MRESGAEDRPPAPCRHTRPPAVAGCGVSRSFDATGPRVSVLHEASWVLEQGMQVALTGPSGSGKSTLLHLMAALDVPTRGKISWPALDKNGDGHSRRIAVVFQGETLVPNLDVTENIALPLLFAGAGESDAKTRAIRAATRLGIAEVATKLPQELSGGQARRVAVARALVAEPALLLADEPTGQLDQTTAAVVIDVLVEASAANGAALVVATHDPQIADRLPGRWTMYDGHLDTGADGKRVPR